MALMDMPARLPTIYGDGVVLREFTDADVPLIQAVAPDPLIPLITTVPATGTVEDARAFIARQHSRLNSGEGYSFAIADPSGDQALGQIGLWLRHINVGRADVGYWVASPYRRCGVAVAALRALSGWALERQEIHRLELYVEPWNEGSWRAAEQVGYQREGLLRSWQQVGDERKDMYVYSLLAMAG
jgi:ribosomal-protein-alanine N-acetyltransferase